MSGEHERAWPVAVLGHLGRLRALAAGLPGVHLHEQVIDAPFDEVWGTVTDLERNTPRYESDVRAVRVVERDGERWTIEARMPLWMSGAPLRFDVTMRDGWCWMVSRPQFYVVGFAAEPLADQTLFGHMEGLAVSSRVPTVLRPATRPLLALSRARHRRHVPRDVHRLAALLE